MLYGLYLSAMGLKAQEARQSVTSNNIANALTTGFKRDLAIMRSRANATTEDPRMAPYRLPIVGDQSGGVYAAGGGIDLSQATLTQSSTPTDLALDGSGFFTVQGNKPGEKLLTRDGSFIINEQGELVMANSGRPVLSAEGEVVKLNPSLPVRVDSRGVISQGDNSGTQLGVVNVSNPERLRKLGANLLTVDKPDALTERNPRTVVRQNYLESSGVDPMIEAVNMMTGQRAFDANAKLISFQDTTLSQLNTIGRVA
jgi:flagellar basal-body rod protein FlgF